MTSRRRGRQFALQILYQQRFSEYEPEKIFTLFWENVKVDPGTRSFSETLVKGVLTYQNQTDLEITAYLNNWSLDRIAIMDHLILRIGFYELIYCRDIPWKVVIDEAVILTKMFSSEKSANFINGVLHAWAVQNMMVDEHGETAETEE